MRFVSVCFLALLLGISGCNSPVQQNQPPVYYDVLGFVKSQIDDLSARKPVVNKVVGINDKQNQESTRSINWTRELELFAQADINKPALRNSYQITRPDSITYLYTLKNEEERLTVRSLRVQLDSVSGQPSRIEAVLQTNNPLYSSERNLLLESEPAGTTWHIRHYKLSGFQKLPYYDKNEFLVEGKVQ